MKVVGPFEIVHFQMPVDIDTMLTPFTNLMRRYPYPPEIELYHNAAAFLVNLFIYVTAFMSGFYIITMSSYIALVILAYAMFHNLRDLNVGWEKRRAEEAAVEDDSDSQKDEVVEQDATEDSESELEEGEIKETTASHEAAAAALEVSDDSQDEDLPPLVPASDINWMDHVN
jgi:hypothetical protein